MTLEKKFQDYINKAQKNYDFTISPRVLIHDLAEIAGNDCIDKTGDMIKTMEDYDVKIQQLEKENKFLTEKCDTEMYCKGCGDNLVKYEENYCELCGDDLKDFWKFTVGGK